MGLIRWLQVLGLTVFAVDQIVDRRRHQRLRAVRRTWRATARTLSGGERRNVGRAVRAGAAVNDPRLAGPARELAAAVLAHPPRTPLRRVGDAVFAAWITAPVVINGFRREWGWMAFAAVWPLLVGAFVVSAPRLRKRAAEALDANRPVRPPREPAVGVAGEPPTLAIGLPQSVARARRLRDRPPPT